MAVSHRYREADIVRVTLVVIFLSLVIIYVAYFQIEEVPFQLTPSTSVVNTGSVVSTGEVFSTPALDNKEDTLVTWALLTWDTNQTWAQSDSLFDATSVIRDIDATQTGIVATTGEILSPETSITNSVDNSNDQADSTTLSWNNTEIIVLSGTKQFFGNIESTQILGLDYKYILTDNESYYVYLGTWDYDFASLARNLDGNIVEIVTEIDILKNDLFWEKIAFVNIPGVTYTTIPVEQKITVFMIVWYNNDRRLLQADYASYHRLKPIMKQRFAWYYEE